MWPTLRGPGQAVTQWRIDGVVKRRAPCTDLFRHWRHDHGHITIAQEIYGTDVASAIDGNYAVVVRRRSVAQTEG